MFTWHNLLYQNFKTELCIWPKVKKLVRTGKHKLLVVDEVLGSVHYTQAIWCLALGNALLLFMSFY